MKTFHLGAILSVTTGRMLAVTGMGEIYAILNHMTGSTLFTHQLPWAGDICGPVLRNQYPELAKLVLDGVTSDNFTEVMTGLVAQHGEQLPVPTLAEWKARVEAGSPMPLQEMLNPEN